MSEAICLVTGATSGIGFETARGIASSGRTVVIVGRDDARCRAAVERLRTETANREIEWLTADLSVQREVRGVADAFRQRYRRLDVLVNNVGGMFLNGQVSADGIEMTLALNHLGYYLLTLSLVDVLRASAPSRVVNVSSVAHLGARIDWKKLDFGGWKGYKRSKLANILFTLELARRLEGTGVAANALSPGLVTSGFGMNNRGLFPLVKPLVYAFAASTPKGAQTSIYLACSPEVEGVTGQYFTRCRRRRSSAASYDRAAAARLWDISARLTGMDNERGAAS